MYCNVFILQCTNLNVLYIFFHYKEQHLSSGKKVFIFKNIIGFRKQNKSPTSGNHKTSMSHTVETNKYEVFIL